MGAIFRVKTFYTDLPVLLSELKQEGLPVFGTFLDGKNIYTTALSTRGLIVMGNVGVATGIILSEFKRRM